MLEIRVIVKDIETKPNKPITTKTKVKINSGDLALNWLKFLKKYKHKIKKSIKILKKLL